MCLVRSKEYIANLCPIILLNALDFSERRSDEVIIKVSFDAQCTCVILKLFEYEYVYMQWCVKLEHLAYQHVLFMVKLQSINLLSTFIDYNNESM